MCLFLHVLQPFLDLVWLFRVGPVPGVGGMMAKAEARADDSEILERVPP